MTKQSQSKQLLLDLPASKMLARFGDGRPTPGSGSASAFLGLFGATMIQGYATLSAARVKPAQGLGCKLINDIITKKHLPELKKYIELDKAIFDEVVLLRKRRDKQRNPGRKKQLQNAQLAKLRKATDIVLKIAVESLAIARFGVRIMEIGFRAARGEAATAVNSALAGAQSGLFVGLLNLASFRSSAWARTRHSECARLWDEIREVQDKLLKYAIFIRADADDAIFGPTAQIDFMTLLGPAQTKIQAVKAEKKSPRLIHKVA